MDQIDPFQYPDPVGFWHPSIDADCLRKERLPVRWGGHCYSEAGGYFVSFCVRNRLPVFGEVVDGAMVPADAGRIAERCLREIPHHFKGVSVDCSVVMPDHIHLVLVVGSQGIGRISDPHRRPFETVPLVVGSYKSAVSRMARACGCQSFSWQKSFHDRIIRDVSEWERIRAYIADNPRSWRQPP